MPEEVSVVVASEQVDVLAPPAEIRVSVGVGANGQRGSLFYAGTAAPEAFFASLSIRPNLMDLYFHTSSQIMYQYVSSPSGNLWSALFDFSSLIDSSVSGAVAAALNQMFSITSPTDGQSLKYNISLGKWTNQ